VRQVPPPKKPTRPRPESVAVTLATATTITTTDNNAEVTQYDPGRVSPAQVAAWAGQSVEVLLRIYAKCIVGQGEVAKRRISEALNDA
jgi:hypothetical protein